jgi:hypothetical protein
VKPCVQQESENRTSVSSSVLGGWPPGGLLLDGFVMAALKKFVCNQLGITLHRAGGGLGKVKLFLEKTRQFNDTLGHPVLNLVDTLFFEVSQS